MSKHWFVVVACWGLFASQNLLAQPAEFQGQTVSGAYYSIVIPDGWQPRDGLVIWNHGYQGYTTDNPQPNPSLGPLEDQVLSQGYAMAASSYSQTGWAVFNSHIDNQQLFQKFVELAGQPQKVFVQGGSLGGIVSIRDLEAGLIPNIDGALLLCSASAGAENWNNAFDLRMVYEAVCDDVSGAQLPTDSWSEQPDPFVGEIEFLDSLERCTGVISDKLLDDPLGQLLRTPGQTARLNKILNLTGTDIEFLLLNMGYAVFEIPNLVNDPSKLNGLLPFGNAGIDYGDEVINLAIKRSAALPSSAAVLLDNYTPTGAIGNARVVSIHTSRDGLVRVENQQILQELIASDQLTTAIVVEEEPSHCGFTDDEGITAWNSLLTWTDSGKQPDAETLLETCLAASGDAGECRFDPDFETGDTLTQFPRGNTTATPALSSFNNNTGLLTIESLQVPGDNKDYNVALQQSNAGSTTFTVESAKPGADIDSWQHRSLFFPDESLLYLPNVKTEPSGSDSAEYNVFMRHFREADQDKVELIEYEIVQ